MMDIRFYTLTALICVVISQSPSISSAKEIKNIEDELITRILSKTTTTSTRPVLNSTQPVQIRFRILVTQVIQMVEKRQVLTISGWMRTEWTDEFIAWNASDYDGVSAVNMRPGSVWEPDITLYNNVDSGFEKIKDDLFLGISSQGNVVKASPAILTSFCRMDVQYFPFDSQHCTLKFGSWTYDGWQLDIDFPDGNHNEQTEFDENGVWELSKVLGEKYVTYYNCCPQPYPNIVYTLILRRRPEFFVGNILLPCVLLSFVTTLVFYLPPECDEKMSFAITNLLAIILFQQLIAETLPPSADSSPLLSQYFTILISMGCISILFTTFVLNIYNNDGKIRAPVWLRLIMIKHVARIVFYTTRSSSTGSQRIGRKKCATTRERDTDNYANENDMCSNVDVVTRGAHRDRTKGSSNGNMFITIRETSLRGKGEFEDSPGHHSNCPTINKELEEILQALRQITNTMKEDEEEAFIMMEWKDIGSILDRIFLLLSLSVAIVATVFIIIVKLTIISGKQPD